MDPIPMNKGVYEMDIASLTAIIADQLKKGKATLGDLTGGVAESTRSA